MALYRDKTFMQPRLLSPMKLPWDGRAIYLSAKEDPSHPHFRALTRNSPTNVPYHLRSLHRLGEGVPEARTSNSE
jgi:hypothetical protein